ncbi:P-loop containing nucleoside triphosphate hydrolase protein [Aulographum hederae CBS 113979]|uniref:P-loop containing nucleoside triphosphate hydrolase protein n=1 Tax=Aulographum hederae CBS 113979 TaxID=1176131 RepID=A0A6G1HDG6_9PEZI|nr:P-loop containing nucleoside triphosphate hydrolase protein [Aulographum hederae CBS 113979]
MSSSAATLPQGEFMAVVSSATADEKVKSGSEGGDSEAFVDVTAAETSEESKNEKSTDSTPSEPLAEPGMKCETKRQYEVVEKGTKEVTWVDDVPERFKDLDSADDEAKRAQYAVLLRTRLVEGKQKLHSIVVQSPYLRKALQDLLIGYPGLALQKDPLEFVSPFKAFVHRWDDFIKICDSHGVEDTDGHFQLLRSILEPEVKASFISLRNFTAPHGAIDFDQLWMLFPPGALLYSSQHDSTFKLKKAEIYVDQTKQRTYYLLHCYYVDWNGKRYGRRVDILAIPEYDGSERVLDLPAYPLEMHPSTELIRETLVERGRRFESFAGVLYRAYDGIAVDKGSSPPQRKHIKGRIVIDAELYEQNNANQTTLMEPLRRTKMRLEPVSGFDNNDIPPSFPPADIYDFRFDQIQNEAIASADDAKSGDKIELTEEELLICTSTLKGYSLRTKEWLEFDVAPVLDIQFSNNAWESLALDNGYKKMLLGFAKSQSNIGNEFDDVIEGKGKGMILLLEGPPGVGKTLTVESVAEEMRVPLYTIAAGELGTESWEVQNQLRQAFDIAAAWKAVILLDEADIFLEKRTLNDIRRNQLVSVFLQHLEYYQGTMFLTTNRVECMDPAFQSRIHLTLPYQNLTPESRAKVWKGFFKNLSVDTSDMTEEYVRKLAEEDLNGRQIKNAVKMAQLMSAAEEREKLEQADVDHVLDVMNKNGSWDPERSALGGASDP